MPCGPLWAEFLSAPGLHVMEGVESSPTLISVPQMSLVTGSFHFSPVSGHGRLGWAGWAQAKHPGLLRSPPH